MFNIRLQSVTDTSSEFFPKLLSNEVNNVGVSWYKGVPAELSDKIDKERLNSRAVDTGKGEGAEGP